MLLAKNAALMVIDFQVRLMSTICNHEKLADKVESFIRGCRALDVSFLVTQQYTKGLGDTLPSIKDALGEFEVIEKKSFSCYDSPEFVKKLDDLGKRDIIVTGIEAHICVQQTVLDLLENGYGAYVVADCIGSRSEPDRLYAEKRMLQAGAVLTTMESVLFEFLRSADHPKRKEISSLVK